VPERLDLVRIERRLRLRLQQRRRDLLRHRDELEQLDAPVPEDLEQLQFIEQFELELRRSP